MPFSAEIKVCLLNHFIYLVIGFFGVHLGGVGEGGRLSFMELIGSFGEVLVPFIQAFFFSLFLFPLDCCLYITM